MGTGLFEQSLDSVAGIYGNSGTAASGADTRPGAERAFGLHGIKLRVYACSVALSALSVAHEEATIAIGTSSSASHASL